MKTQYLVLPYRLGARNQVEAEQAQACRTDAEALRAGERIARRSHGVVVMAQDYDEAADFAAEPVVLAVHGTVPDSWGASEAAA